MKYQKISPQYIMIGGIRQGCAMSLSLPLSLDYAFAGFIGMCGYLPFQKDVEEAVSSRPQEKENEDPFSGDGDENLEELDPAVKALIFERDLLCLDRSSTLIKDSTARSTPIFLSHGDADEKKPYELGETDARMGTRCRVRSCLEAI